MRPRLDFRRIVFGAVLTISPVVLGAGGAASDEKTDTTRLVTLGGSVSEVVCDLGACDRVVGSDESSLSPPSLAQKPRVGYYRAVSAEGILSLKPTLVLATDQTAPATALDRIRAAKTPLIVIDSGKTIEGAKRRIKRIAELLGAQSVGDDRIRKIDAAIKRVGEKVRAAKESPRVLFVYARGAKLMQVGGRANAASEMIALAGGKLALDSFEGYKPMTAEAVVAANPDVILMTTSGAESVGQTAGILALPGVGTTKAGKAKRIVLMDDLLLLGFDSRVGEALEQLYKGLHP